MNIAELIKVESLKDEVNQINEYMDILRDYGFIRTDVTDKDINKIRARLGIFLIKTNSELKLLLQKLNLGTLIE